MARSKKRKVAEKTSKVAVNGVTTEHEESTGNGRELDGYVSGGDRKIVGSAQQKKIFVARESVLTVLSRDDSNFRSLYHAFNVMVVTAIVYSLLKDSVDAGSLHIDLGILISGFTPPHQSLKALLVWLPLQSAAFIVFPAFKVWEKSRRRLGRFADAVGVVLALTYNVLAHYVVIAAIVNINLPPIPSLVLALEQLRFSLKSYSFIRENAVKVIQPWRKDDEDGPAIWYKGQMEPTVGSFNKYLYFLFAPTLLYRDCYPRIPRVRKSRVFAHFLKCCISMAFIIIFVKEVFIGFTKSWQPLARTFLSCMLWGLVLQFMAGYFFLHSWNNLFGELLRFADRQFYSDWWTSHSFSQFYRKWNLIVHDWIKAYIYQDFKNFFKNPHFNKLAFVPAIIMSAIYHEYVLWAPFRFVLPILLLQYSTFGVVLFAVKPSSHSSWNYLVHVGLHLGVSIMVFCYVMEFHARSKCPKEENAVNTFVPRFFECFFS